MSPSAVPLEERVLVLMPSARDAERTSALLAEAGLVGTACDDMTALCREIGQGVGAALLSDEALVGDGGTCLARALANQPPWSDVPLVLLSREGADGRYAAFRESLNATLVERPVRMRTLLSVLRSALRARRHQYEVRDLLVTRAHAEDAVRERDERLKLFLGNATDYAVIISDREDRVLEWLGGAELITGWREAEVLGRPTDFIFTPEDRAAGVPEAEIRTAAATGRVPNTRWHQRKDGSRFFAEGVTVSIRSPAGEFRGFGKVFRDATARKLAEERLTRDATLLASVHDAVIVTDLDGVVSYWNEGASRLFGWTADEMVGRPYADRFDEPARSWVAAEIRARASGVEWSGEYEDYRKDGTRVWIDARVARITDSTGRPVAVLGVSRDITERKRAEDALRASDERFRAFMDHSPAAGWVTGPDGTIQYLSGTYSRMFKLPDRDLVGARPSDLYPEDFAQEYVRNIRAVAETGQPLETVERAPRPDGSVGEFLVYKFPLPAGMIGGVAVDITERLRAEEALRDADRKKDDFIALLAHELRNPLAPLRNGLQIIRLSPDRDSRNCAQQVMERQLAHMVRLIDDLLDVSRISRNKMELRLARILLSDVVGSAVETARPAIEAAGHELTVSLPPDPVFLDADLTRLSQVFSNLLTNSAKYTEHGGHIALTAGLDGDNVVVSVRDTGIGIPAESLPRIFDMFSQVDRSIERSTGGLGIGLALVKGLVEMHGGTVGARSDGPGRGSEFTVRLPAVRLRSGRPEAHRPSRDGTPSGPGRRILVVDDNRDSAESMGAMLRLFGNEVALAHDGEEAVERAEAFRPEVILMDVGMPRLNGYEATRRIRAEPWGKGIAIIALTGWGQDADRVRSQEAGCDGHLVKPVSLPDLQNVLGKLA
jgi:PAS domain S-box-containing protein